MGPRGVLRRAGITRDMVLDAIHRRADISKRTGLGLCNAFAHSKHKPAGWESYEIVPMTFALLNGHGLTDDSQVIRDMLERYSMPYGERDAYHQQQQDQRDMLLAFMLTWLEEE